MNANPLVDLLVPDDRARELRAAVMQVPAWTLSVRQVCDFELLANGGFSPLAGFLARPDYQRVLGEMRLADGRLWPVPIMLGVSRQTAHDAERAGSLALRDSEGAILGVLRVEDAWEPDIAAEAESVYGTASREHAGVEALFQDPGEVYLGGRVEALRLPEHFDFPGHRYTPSALRSEFRARGWDRVVAFQTRNPMHRAHYELTVRAVERTGAKLLLHPSVGATKIGDVDHFTRVRCYRALLPRYGEGGAMLALLPLAMRMAGPREALWHALIRKNYGCTHFIVGRDHAGPGPDASGKAFYGPYDSHGLVTRFAAELGIEVVCSRDFSYVPEANAYFAEGEVPKGAKILSLSGTEFRRRLETGEEIPEWLSFPEVIEALRPRHGRAAGRQDGCVVFFTGLPASGKSTLAKALAARLLEAGRGPVTVLDADEVRRKHWPELGFSKEDRDENIRRLGKMAAEQAANGGVVLCAAIAPYDAVRKEVRAAVEPNAGFLLVHVATPLEVCEARDPKGLYAKARAGIVKHMTGLTDPYEEPTDADIRVGVDAIPPTVSAGLILQAVDGLIAPGRA